MKFTLVFVHYCLQQWPWLSLYTSPLSCVYYVLQLCQSEMQHCCVLLVMLLVQHYYFYFMYSSEILALPVPDYRSYKKRFLIKKRFYIVKQYVGAKWKTIANFLLFLSTFEIFYDLLIEKYLVYFSRLILILILFKYYALCT